MQRNKFLAMLGAIGIAPKLPFKFKIPGKILIYPKDRILLTWTLTIR